MKSIAQTALAAITLALLAGCTGLQSEMEKSAVNAASPTATVAGHELHLTATLAQQPIRNKKGFDLTGTIAINAQNENFPADLAITRLSLKPSWKGWPGYFNINFFNRSGLWERPGEYEPDDSFKGFTRMTNGAYTIQFTWRDQGAGMGTKPEHFVAYDISVTVIDSQKQRHLLSLLNVPTK